VKEDARGDFHETLAEYARSQVGGGASQDTGDLEGRNGLEPENDLEG